MRHDEIVHQEIEVHARSSPLAVVPADASRWEVTSSKYQHDTITYEMLPNSEIPIVVREVTLHVTKQRVSKQSLWKDMQWPTP